MAIIMSQHEIAEGRRAGIPEYLLGKMIYGLDLTEREKEVVKGRGKVYVLGYRKYGGRTTVDPQLRDLPRGSLFLGNPGHKIPKEEFGKPILEERKLLDEKVAEFEEELDRLEDEISDSDFKLINEYLDDVEDERKKDMVLANDAFESAKAIFSEYIEGVYK